MVPEWARATFAVVTVIVAVAAYRNGASRPTADDRERGRRLGAILMLVGGAISVTTIGTIFAERSPEDPAPLAAWFLFGAATIVGMSGVTLRMGARVRAKAHPPGIRGRALIRSVEEAGPGVSGLPVWVLALDVTAPGIDAFRTELHEEIPRQMAESLEEGGHVPVLVDDGDDRRVTLDWLRSSESVADDEFRAPFSPTPQGPPLASRATSSAVGRLVKLLLPFALIVLVMNVTNRLIDPTDDAPPTVVPTGDHSGVTLGGAAVESPPGVEPAYSFVAPEGWVASARFVESPLQAMEADLVLTRVDGSAEAMFVGRLRRAAGAHEPLRALLPAITRRLGATEFYPAVVDGEAAAVLDIGAAQDAYRQAAVAVREGAVVVVASFATGGDGAEARAALGVVLESWSWD